MATLVVVRHGEAEGNRDHRFVGHSQVPLTAHGQRQAEAVADRLSGEAIVRIVSSDLIRCVETVRPLALRTGLDVETDDRLREVGNGEWTGLLPEEIAARWPSLWSDYAAGADVQRPGGETWGDVADRVLPVADELLALDGIVVVATHSGPTLLLAMWATGIEPEGNIFRRTFSAPHNAALTVIGEGPRLVTFNDTGHVAPLADQRLPFAPVSSP